MRVLALDQATHTGFAVLERDDSCGYIKCLTHGCWDCSVKSTRKKGDPKKPTTEGVAAGVLQSLFGRLVLTSDQFRVNCVVVENIYPGCNLKTFIPLIEIRAIAKMAAHLKGLTYACYAPQEARGEFGLSRGDEGKPQAYAMMVKKFPQIEGSPFDTTDAALLGFYHLHLNPIARLSEGTDIFPDVG